MLFVELYKKLCKYSSLNIVRKGGCKVFNQHKSIKNNDNNKITSLFDNNTIRIITIGCIVILLALISMSSVSIVLTRNAALNKLKTSDIKNLAGAFSSTIEAKIEKAIDVSLILANDQVVVNWIESNDQDEELGEIVKNKMGDIVGLGYDTSFLASGISNNYWSFHGQEFRLLNVLSKDDIQDNWFFHSLDMKKKYEINIDHNKVLKDTFVWINTLVGNIDKPIAVSGVGMNLSNVIKGLIKEETEQEIRYDIWLVDGKGDIHLSNNPEDLGRPLSYYIPSHFIESIITTNYQQKEYEVLDYKSEDGEIYDFAYKRIENTDWILLVQISRSESLGFMKPIVANTIFAFFVILLVMLILFNVVINKLANPYKQAVLMRHLWPFLF